MSILLSNVYASWKAWPVKVDLIFDKTAIALLPEKISTKGQMGYLVCKVLWTGSICFSNMKLCKTEYNFCSNIQSGTVIQGFVILQ